MNQKTSIILNAILFVAVILLFKKVYTCGGSNCCKKDNCENITKDTLKTDTYIPVKDDGQLNIAFIQYDSINASYKFLLDKKKQLESESKSVESRLRGEMQKIQNRQKELEGQVKFMSQSEIQAAEQELQKKAMDYQKLEEKLVSDLQEKEAFFQKQLYGNVEEYLSKYAAERGIDFVFRYERGLNLMFGNSAFDITTEVLKGLNDEYTSAMGNKK